MASYSSSGPSLQKSKDPKLFFYTIFKANIFIVAAKLKAQTLSEVGE